MLSEYFIFSQRQTLISQKTAPTKIQDQVGAGEEAPHVWQGQHQDGQVRQMAGGLPA